jgi:hypothetical protein
MTGYSGTPLAKKLGIKPGATTFLKNPPSAVRATLAPALADARIVNSLVPEIDFILGFVTSRTELKADFVRWKRGLAKTGCLWVCWPKRTSAIGTDLTGDVVREVGLAAALVDVKVCAIDEEWSGLKFVFRRADR